MKAKPVPTQQWRSRYLAQAKRRVKALDANVQKLCKALDKDKPADPCANVDTLELAARRAKRSSMNIVAALVKLEHADADRWENARNTFEDAWEDVGDAIVGVMRRIAHAPTDTKTKNTLS